MKITFISATLRIAWTASDWVQCGRVWALLWRTAVMLQELIWPRVELRPRHGLRWRRCQSLYCEYWVDDVIEVRYCNIHSLPFVAVSAKESTTNMISRSTTLKLSLNSPLLAMWTHLHILFLCLNRPLMELWRLEWKLSHTLLIMDDCWWPNIRIPQWDWQLRWAYWFWYYYYEDRHHRLVEMERKGRRKAETKWLQRQSLPARMAKRKRQLDFMVNHIVISLILINVSFFWRNDFNFKLFPRLPRHKPTVPELVPPTIWLPPCHAP